MVSESGFQASKPSPEPEQDHYDLGQEDPLGQRHVHQDGDLLVQLPTRLQARTAELLLGGSGPSVRLFRRTRFHRVQEPMFIETA